ncbi:N-myc protein-like [Ascaphus truei]|uniref:N-myc protein-like n=1 Tax=Ascaphus truei TaxID=8439 RepID=UPI003F59D1A5
MSWVVSNNSDVEFESLQPCFYPDEDDFYLCSPDSDLPGEDIWKKFELVPTHSLSLSSARLQSGPLSPCQGSLLEYGLHRDGNALDWASERLLLPPEADLLGVSGWALLQGTELGWSPSNLMSNIIQDCMWSGTSAMGRQESALIEKLSKAAGTMKCATPSQPGTTTASMVPGRIEVMSNPTSHSVDPVVVFPFPVNKGESCRGTQGGSVTARGATSPPCTSPTAPSSAAPARNSTQCCRTSTSSEYESHSDSGKYSTFILHANWARLEDSGRELQKNPGRFCYCQGCDLFSLHISNRTILCCTSQEQHPVLQDQRQLGLMRTFLPCRASLLRPAFLSHTRSLSHHYGLMLAPAENLGKLLPGTGEGEAGPQELGKAGAQLPAAIRQAHRSRAWESSPSPPPWIPQYISIALKEEAVKKEEEEEEVDGTVEKRCTSSNNPGTSLTITLLPKNSNAAFGKTAQNKSILKQCAPAHQQHNYAVLSPYVKPDKVASAQKKHTVLERQRRNNLTTRLLTLKHNVPELVNNDKAANAFILKKATEYIHSLQADNQKLLQAKEKLQARQQRLLKKLKHTWTC